MNVLKKTGLLIMVVLLVSACKKPTENITLVVDTDILKYTALVYVTDGSNGGPAPSDASISLSGDAAQDIYELSGKKAIALSAGVVTIGLNPNVAPADGDPIHVTLEISASGYKKEARDVVFEVEKKQQIIQIPLSKIGSSAPPVVLPPPTVYDNTVSLNFTGTCPDRNDLKIRPSVYVFFRVNGSANGFQYLGYMEKGNIRTNLLLLGKTYDFQIAFGGEAYLVTQEIGQLNYDLSLDMPAACNF
ncbi:MAG TPA: hypothetical protein VK541_14615 [Pedobacter sp.]|uniref:hypothetical protein n=1 Tax=Pedobacter sp. TaxID=1411316 RepID=UPI002CD72B96|nr:hypothetical protein [Pedobacter sp.]HMI03713.1 hypothetical protein [Pedobacter sp.]